MPESIIGANKKRLNQDIVEYSVFQKLEIFSEIYKK
jgi:hypothetical protein